MNRRELLMAMAAAGSLAGCGSDEYFFYQNPITEGIHPEGIRDCQIFTDEGKWWMTGTSAPFWQGPNPGVRLYMSRDLLNWEDQGLLIDRQTLSEDVWYYDRFWAPEIHRFDGKYYLCFNCRNEKLEKPHSCFLAVADSLSGPYEVMTKDPPLTRGNDLTLYRDDDGKTYAFFNQGQEFGIGCGEMDLETCRFKSEPRSMIAAGGEGEWDKIGIEGSCVVKNGGTYYLFYSSWTRGYEIGYATAKTVTGPYTKHPGNPFYGAQNRQNCEKNGVAFTGEPESHWQAAGHNQVFRGPDGRNWISCHGILKSTGKPFLVIDPFDFDEGGTIISKGPTDTMQQVRTK